MNQIIFVDIPTTHLKRAQRFYESLFGWRFYPIGGVRERVRLDTGGSVNGYLRRVPRIPRTAGVLFYVEVADIDQVLARVRRLGGRIIQQKSEMPERGWTAIITTFDGCQLGLWQPYWSQAA